MAEKIVSNTEKHAQFERVLAAVDRHLYWLPYLTATLLIWCDYQVHRIIHFEGLGTLVLSKKGLLSIATSIFAFILTGLQLTLCCRRATRIKALFSVGLAGLLVFGFLIVAEVVLPPVYRYSRFQHNIQEQLSRRLQRKTERFCGVDTRADANFLGWIDRERDYSSSQARVLFIGDSFLETRASRAVAGRVEDILSKRGIPSEIINLSKDDTDPETEYRHKFYEFAFEYNPDHIFLFIYSGNDFSTKYRYEPYTHPYFRVDKKTIDFLEKTGLDEPVLTTLRQVNARNPLLKSKIELFNELNNVNLDLKYKNLIYLACIGYSRLNEIAPSERLFPNALARIKIARKELSNRLKSIEERIKTTHSHHRCASIDVDQLRDHYEEIYNLPEDQRLEKIARFIASEYCQDDDPRPYYDILAKQDPEFIRQIVRYPASLYLVPATVSEALSGVKKHKKIKMHRVERASDEYVKLFTEFHDIARQRGVGLTVVLIPVATNIDSTFLRCWGPLRGIEKSDGRGPPMLAAVARKLKGKIPVVDLSKYPQEFDGGYWLFDGHWNEKGNQAVAEILVNYTASTLRRPVQ